MRVERRRSNGRALRLVEKAVVRLYARELSAVKIENLDSVVGCATKVELARVVIKQ